MALSKTVSGETLESGFADYPNHTISIADAGEAVTVEHNGRRLARSDAALTLHEGKYPPVYYLPRADIDEGAFKSTETSSWCPFKGRASYLALSNDADGLGDVAWIYEDPFTEVGAIAGYVAFYPNKVTIRTES